MRSLVGVHRYKTYTHSNRHGGGRRGARSLTHKNWHTLKDTHIFPKWSLGERNMPEYKERAFQYTDKHSLPVKGEMNPASTHTRTVTQYTHCTLWSTLTFLFISTLLCLAIPGRHTNIQQHTLPNPPLNGNTLSHTLTQTHFENFSFVLSCHVAEQSEVQRGEERKKSCLKQSKRRHPVEHRSLV